MTFVGVDYFPEKSSIIIATGVDTYTYVRIHVHINNGDRCQLTSTMIKRMHTHTHTHNHTYIAAEFMELYSLKDIAAQVCWLEIERASEREKEREREQDTKRHRELYDFFYMM